MTNNTLVSLLEQHATAEVYLEYSRLDCQGHTGDERCYCREKTFRERVISVDKVIIDVDGKKLPKQVIVLNMGN